MQLWSALPAIERRAQIPYLAVVKGAGNGKVVDVLVKDGGHLRLLDGRHATLRVHDEDGNILLSTKTIDGGGTRVTAGGTDDGQVVSISPRLALVLSDQEVLEQITEELQSNILKGKSRTVEEFEEICVVGEVDEGSGLGGAEGGITAVDDVLEVGRGNLGGGDVEGEDLEGQFGEAEVLPRLPCLGLGDVLGDIKAAIVGETF